MKLLDQYRAAEEIGRQRLRLATFDTRDFEVFSRQEWSRLHESHSSDIVVHWPDRRETRGVDVHIEDLNNMFIQHSRPDTHISASHQVQIDDRTSVMGIIEATFTKPLPTGNGKSIPATQKASGLMTVTVGHWRVGGMDEEYLFRGNAAHAQQIGLG